MSNNTSEAGSPTPFGSNNPLLPGDFFLVAGTAAATAAANVPKPTPKRMAVRLLDREGNLITASEMMQRCFADAHWLNRVVMMQCANNHAYHSPFCAVVTFGTGRATLVLVDGAPLPPNLSDTNNVVPIQRFAVHAIVAPVQEFNNCRNSIESLGTLGEGEALWEHVAMCRESHPGEAIGIYLQVVANECLDDGGGQWDDDLKQVFQLERNLIKKQPPTMRRCRASEALLQQGYFKNPSNSNRFRQPPLSPAAASVAVGAAAAVAAKRNGNSNRKPTVAQQKTSVASSSTRPTTTKTATTTAKPTNRTPPATKKPVASAPTRTTPTTIIKTTATRRVRKPAARTTAATATAAPVANGNNTNIADNKKKYAFQPPEFLPHEYNILKKAYDDELTNADLEVDTSVVDHQSLAECLEWIDDETAYRLKRQYADMGPYVGKHGMNPREMLLLAKAFEVSYDDFPKNLLRDNGTLYTNSDCMLATRLARGIDKEIDEYRADDNVTIGDLMGMSPVFDAEIAEKRRQSAEAAQRAPRRRARRKSEVDKNEKEIPQAKNEAFGDQQGAATSVPTETSEHSGNSGGSLAKDLAQPATSTTTMTEMVNATETTDSEVIASSTPTNTPAQAKGTDPKNKIKSTTTKKRADRSEAPARKRGHQTAEQKKKTNDEPPKRISRSSISKKEPQESPTVKSAAEKGRSRTNGSDDESSSDEESSYSGAENVQVSRRSSPRRRGNTQESPKGAQHAKPSLKDDHSSSSRKRLAEEIKPPSTPPKRAQRQTASRGSPSTRRRRTSK